MLVIIVMLRLIQPHRPSFNCVGSLEEALADGVLDAHAAPIVLDVRGGGGEHGEVKLGNCMRGEGAHDLLFARHVGVPIVPVRQVRLNRLDGEFLAIDDRLGLDLPVVNHWSGLEVAHGHAKVCIDFHCVKLHVLVRLSILLDKSFDVISQTLRGQNLPPNGPAKEAHDAADETHEWHPDDTQPEQPWGYLVLVYRYEIATLLLARS
mmetsp:Transcript_45789/g.93722  ORF Transcript_45789/g.93722 Transcript_45789/m.93722 type:complete len:207 (-) Transcript_45789:587-1207(-)